VARILAVVLLLAALTVAVFGSVMFQDRTFVFRDAGHFYYPLFGLVTDEYQAGRVPLWNIWENSGHPLAANPAAGAFYPGKAVFLLLPYPIAYKAYTILHVALAFLAAYLLFRGWRLSRPASAFGATAYAFGGYVLFQTCNIVFLCGAAWLPLVLLTGQRVLEYRTLPWIVGLAACVAMTLLCGDPQAGYLAGGLLLMLAFLRWRGGRDGEGQVTWGRLLGAAGLVVVLAALAVPLVGIPTGTALRIAGVILLVHFWLLPEAPRAGLPRVAAIAGTAVCALALLAPSPDVLLVGPEEMARYVDVAKGEVLSAANLLRLQQARELTFQRYQLLACGVGLCLWAWVVWHRLRRPEGSSGLATVVAGAVGAAAVLLIAVHAAPVGTDSAPDAWGGNLPWWLLVAASVFVPLVVILWPRRPADDQQSRRLKWAVAAMVMLWAGLGFTVARRVVTFDRNDALAVRYGEKRPDAVAFYRSEVPSWIVRFACVPLVVSLWFFWRGGLGVGAADTRSDRRGVAALVAGATVAGLLAAVQLLPAAELTRHSLRGVGHEEAPRTPYMFSLFPTQPAELLVPNVSGRLFIDNSCWLARLEPSLSIWVPSHYMGLMTLLLAGVALVRLRDGRAAWPAVMLIVAVPAALGKHLTLYPMLYEALPGLSPFRYPGKLMLVVSLALAGLAGIGFDRVFGGEAVTEVRRRCRRLTGTAVAIALACAGGALAVWAATDRILGWMGVNPWPANLFGPPSPGAAVDAVIGGLAHAAGAACVGAVIVLGVWRGWLRRWVWVAAAVGVLAVDLWVANGWMVITGPQAALDRPSPVAEAIRRDAERHGYDSQPYRIHRMPSFHPPQFYRTRSTERLDRTAEEVPIWETETLQAKYHMLHALPEVHSIDTLNLYAYDFFFGAFRSPTLKQVNRPVAYHPRKSYDIWNTRYFVVPKRMRPEDENRGTLAFLVCHYMPELEPLLASEQAGSTAVLGLLVDAAVVAAHYDFDAEKTYAGLLGLDEDMPPARRERRKRSIDAIRPWLDPLIRSVKERVVLSDDEKDILVVRNEDALDRTWIVHRHVSVPMAPRRSRVTRKQIMEPLTYKRDMLWRDRQRQWLDLRQVVVIEEPRPDGEDAGIDWTFRRPGGALEGEASRVVRYGPQHQVVEATLTAPGWLVMSDAWYPGWECRVDGEPRPIERANAMMRAVRLEPGTHTVAFVYRPMSFRIGWWVTVAAVLGCIVALGIGWVRRGAGGRDAS